MTPLELLERKSRLWHIERAAQAIVSCTTGRSLEAFLEDEVLRMAVERQFVRALLA